MRDELTPAEVDEAASALCRPVLPGMLQEHKQNFGPPIAIALNHDTWEFLTGRKDDSKLLQTTFRFDDYDLTVVLSEDVPNGEVKIATAPPQEG